MLAIGQHTPFFDFIQKSFEGMAAPKQVCTGKVVLVGDGACGKTCLLEVFKRNKFPEDYIPTVVDNFVKDVQIDDNRIVSLTLWDTAGQEAYDSVRPMSYTMTDLLLLCYSIENKDMLPNITEKWIPEIKNFCPSTSFFIVGLKKDIRNSQDYLIDYEKVVPYEMGEAIARENEASKFFECSAKTGENVSEVFRQAALFILDNKKKQTSRRISWCMCC